MQIGAHVLGQHRYRAPGDDGKSGHVQDRLDDDLDMEVGNGFQKALQRLLGVCPCCIRAASVTSATLRGWLVAVMLGDCMKGCHRHTEWLCSIPSAAYKVPGTSCKAWQGLHESSTSKASLALV